MSNADHIRQFVVGPIETNCYAYISDGKCMVVDPGASGAALAKELLDVEVISIVATHGHHDHVCGVKALKQATGADFYVSKDDAWRVTQALELSSHAFQLPDNPEEEDAPEPDHLLSEGDVLELGSAAFRVMETPGHTEGGITLVGEKSAEGVVFVGDTLFKDSAGRTDLRGGDFGTLMVSLERLARELAADAHILSGHGEATTMGREIAYNRFYQGMDLSN